MNKEYDPKNNDTYDIKYVNDMVSDVEAHMFKDDNAAIVGVGGLRGNFSVESRIIASNNVLQFPNAKDLWCKLLKNINYSNFVPYSLKKRYSHTLYNNSYTQKTPIFFNIETEKFVIPFDKRFLRDIDKYPSFKENIKEFLENKKLEIINTTYGEQLVINYDNLNEIIVKDNKINRELNKIYIKTLLEIYPNEDVIIITYKLNETNGSMFQNKGNPKIKNKDMNQNTNIKLEILKARKIDDSQYFLYTKEGLDTEESFYFNKDKIRKAKINQSNDIKDYFLGEDKSLLTIIPYSDNDWDFLIKLQENINDIFNGLNDILLKQKNEFGLDKPLSLIESNKLLLINSIEDNKNIKKKGI